MAPATTSLRGPRKTNNSRGFTLLELSLALALLVLLTGVSVYGFAGWQRTAALNEGSDRFATLLRAARIEAASVGKRLQLGLSADDDTDIDGAGIDVLWEPDAFEAGGEFVAYDGLFTRSHSPGELVRVRRCRLTGDSAYRVLALPTADVDPDLQEVLFYPDGSSDSAEIALISTNSRDHRGVVIELNGLTGVMQITRMTEEQFEQWLDESE